MHLNSSEVRAKDNYRKSSVIKTLAPWAHVRFINVTIFINSRGPGRTSHRHVRVGVGQSEPSTSGLTVNV